MIGPWLRLSIETTHLAAEAGEVVARRLAMFARGDAGAAREAHRMVAEKVRAAGEAALSGGALPAVKLYRRRVRANARRLRKG
ncbi:hypothetical protein [Methylobacterium sp. JK268]